MPFMGIEKNGVTQKVSKRWKTCIVLLCSILVSMVGGAVLVIWLIRYHSRNRELWMVPFGLVMFTTPMLVWLISIAADACCPKEEQLVDSVSTTGQPLAMAGGSRSVEDPER